MSIYFCCLYRWRSLRIKIAYSPENVVVTCLTRFLVFDPVPNIRIPGVIEYTSPVRDSNANKTIWRHYVLIPKAKLRLVFFNSKLSWDFQQCASWLTMGKYTFKVCVPFPMSYYNKVTITTFFFQQLGY